jgi:hypothetical protein
MNTIADGGKNMEGSSRPDTTTQLTIWVDGRAVTLSLRGKSTLLECARFAGLRPPAS